MKHEGLEELYSCIQKRKDCIGFTKENFQYLHLIEYYTRKCDELIS
ncbi:MAG: hypothetical protein HOK63_02425 [Thaumarchaeota archaeon]|jgi:hypothetical protein|nr:hypothetical protein [Nitrososphaerota archaeon]MBT5843105.1 hypothetical protein [Nitrososphaerota archaeon]MBT6468494.1 hypothetical protein [Nitrososphaerota archaeon]